MASAHSERTAWALFYGLAERESRRLVVVLPHDAAFATMQRTAWLISGSARGTARRCALTTP
jgi:hypothetical protein